MTITPAPGSVPGTSATTLPDWRRPMLRGVRVSRIRTGWPRREDALQLLGVGDGERAGRDRPDALGEGLDAGMRVAVIIGADRADDDADRALAAGDGRAAPARRAERAVAGAVLVGLHIVGDEDDPAAHRRIRRRLQRLDAVEMDDLGLDAALPASRRYCRAR